MPFGIYAEEDSLQKRLDELIKQKSNYGLRADGTPKGLGFFGELQRPDKGVMTEYSIGVDFDGKETEIPTIVPTLTPEELDFLLQIKSGNELPESIKQKAIEHAKMRMAKGLNPFAQEGEQRPRPDNLQNRLNEIIGRKLAPEDPLQSRLDEMIEGNQKLTTEKHPYIPEPGEPPKPFSFLQQAAPENVLAAAKQIPEIPKWISEYFTKLVPQTAATMLGEAPYRGMEKFAGTLQKGSEAIGEKLGLQPGTFFQEMSTDAAKKAQWFKERGVPEDETFARTLLLSPGMAIPDLAMMSAGGKLGLPTWITAKKVMEEPTVGGLAKGAAEGLAWYAGLKLAGLVPRGIRYPAALGGVYATSKGTPEERLAQAISFLPWIPHGKGYATELLAKGLESLSQNKMQAAQDMYKRAAEEADVSRQHIERVGRGVQKLAAKTGGTVYVFSPTLNRPNGELGFIHPSPKQKGDYQLSFFDVDEKGEPVKALDDMQFKTEQEATAYINKIIESEKQHEPIGGGISDRL
jgi:hypothetical protein